MVFWDTTLLFYFLISHNWVFFIVRIYLSHFSLPLWEGSKGHMFLESHHCWITIIELMIVILNLDGQHDVEVMPMNITPI
jgi:hypothetical protein